MVYLTDPPDFGAASVASALTVRAGIGEVVLSLLRPSRAAALNMMPQIVKQSSRDV